MIKKTGEKKCGGNWMIDDGRKKEKTQGKKKRKKKMRKKVKGEEKLWYET